MDEAFLVGTWRLVEWSRPRAPGTVPKSFVGRLAYLRERRMFVVIHAGGRERLALDNPLDARPEELARAAQGAVAYSGRWRLRHAGQEAWVEHQVDASLFPNWLPKDEDEPAAWQRRALRVLGPDDVELSSTPADGDVTRLRWRRLKE